jgi:alpha-tubulin suppressor-like RCC1 family protein
MRTLALLSFVALLPLAQAGVRAPAPAHVYAQGSYSCVLFDDEVTLKCFGYNSFGQLGYQGSGQAGQPIQPVKLGGRKIKQVALGEEHACALIQDGDVMCWGGNTAGQLGVLNYNILSQTEPVKVALPAPAKFLASGQRHSCAITQDSRVFCWGSNDQQQAYDPNASNVYQNLSNAYQTGTVREIVLRGAKPIELALGSGHTAVLFEDGNVQMWGNTLTSRFADPKPMQNLLFGDEKVKHIVSGPFHLCGLFAAADGKNETWRCWGQNTYGQLGIGSTNTQIPRMGTTLEKVKVDPDRDPMVVFPGNRNSCALMPGFVLKCYGSEAGINLTGPEIRQLGVLPGDVFDRSVDLGPGLRVIEAALGFFHACAIAADYHVVPPIKGVKCWGQNGYYGQLGTASTSPILTPEQLQSASLLTLSP